VEYQSHISINIPQKYHIDISQNLSVPIIRTGSWKQWWLFVNEYVHSPRRQNRIQYRQYTQKQKQKKKNSASSKQE